MHSKDRGFRSVLCSMSAPIFFEAPAIGESALSVLCFVEKHIFGVNVFYTPDFISPHPTYYDQRWTTLWHVEFLIQIKAVGFVFERMGGANS